MSPQVQHEHSCVPITALEALNYQVVLAGEGPYLHAYSRNESKCLGQIKVFNSQQIHGIVSFGQDSSGSFAIIWGGKLVRLINIRIDGPSRASSHVAFSLGPRIEAQDWILHISLPSEDLTPGSVRKAIAVTAHNAVLKLEANCDLHQRLELTVTQLTVPSRCLLFSAHAIWLSSARVLVAAGTAFGEIVVWSHDVDSTKQARSKTHHIFTGHEGSVFGVQISHAIDRKGPESVTRVLASCSDDRSIRIWNISELPDMPVDETDDLADLIASKDTGLNFRAGDIIEAESQSLCVAQVWAHISRIWSVQFLPCDETFSNDDILARLVSVGEDATSISWELSLSQGNAPENEHQRRLTLRRTGALNLHEGKNIWSFSRSPNSWQILTGGADGKVVETILPQLTGTKQRDFFHETRTIESIMPTGLKNGDGSSASQGSGKKVQSELFRCLAFVDTTTLLAATSRGNILQCRINLDDSSDGKSHTCWSQLGHFDELQGVSFVLTPVGFHYILFLSAYGDIIACSRRSKKLVKILASGNSRKVYGKFTTQVSNDQSHSCLVITTRAGYDTADIYFITATSKGLEAHASSVKLPFLHLTFLSAVVIDDRFTIMIGGRDGRLATTQVDLSSDGRLPLFLELSSVSRPHTDAVTGIEWIPRPSPQPQELYFFVSVGRDRLWCICSYNSSSGEMTLLHQASILADLTIEGVCLSNSRILVYGFGRTHFVLYDVILEQELMAVDCGRGRLLWSFLPFTEEEQTIGQANALAWTQTSSFNIYRKSRVRNHCLKDPGNHGRDIKAVAISRVMPRLIATGAEDTNIRLYKYSCSSDGSVYSQFHHIRTMRKHDSGIQHLQWSQDGNHLFSSAGVEEFYVWRVRFDVPLIGVGTVCESICPPISTSPDQRIMSFDARWLEDDNYYEISMAYSDSTVRVYRYAYSSGASWNLLSTGVYQTCCLSQCVKVDIPNGPNLLTGATDGHLAFWPFAAVESNNILSEASSIADTAILSWAHRSRIHQSNIKALSSAQVADDRYLILTGGDDNGIAVSLLTVAPEIKVESLLIPHAHAAAVNASALIAESSKAEATESNGGRNLFWAISSGNDQRLKVWSIEVNRSHFDLASLTIKKEVNVGTAVADVSNMEVWEEQDMLRVLVVGVGMEVFTVRL